MTTYYLGNRRNLSRCFKSFQLIKAVIGSSKINKLHYLIAEVEAALQ